MRSKKIISPKKNNFSSFKNLKSKLFLVFGMLISAAFLIGYFFFITSYYGGIENAQVIDDTTDLVIAFVVSILFMLAILNDYAGKELIIWGAVGIFLEKLAEVIIQENPMLSATQNYQLLAIIWVFLRLIYFLGIIGILNALRYEK